MTPTTHSQTLFAHYRAIPSTYDALHAFCPLRPLRGEAEYARVVASALAGHAFTPEQEDYLGTLGALLVAYEDQHLPMQRPQRSGLDARKDLLRDHGMHASDLSRVPM